MMKKILLIAGLLMAAYISSMAQTVKQVNTQDLQTRFKAGRDTVYVVNFWATWCKPCIQELPYFEKFSAENKSRPVKVLLVNVDAKSKLESSVKPFIKKNGLKNEVLFLNETAYQAKIDKNWKGALPATLIVNGKTGERKFNAKALTYDELVKVYKEVAN
ncbi:MAG: TlpA disulfide reductase family protein [Daejeonella sp.]|uniref:TlpA disulfide reductase family protein n=1 Tax=Daejeonella sp. TaxID=2805397 RepID=UPI003C7157E2